MNFYTVSSTRPERSKKLLSLAGQSAKSVRIVVSRYACVGKDDTVVLESSNISKLYVQSAEDPDDLIQVSPHFEEIGEYKFSNRDLRYRINEVNTDEDVNAVTYLEQFHYKSSNFTNSEDSSVRKGSKTKGQSYGGRKAVLVLYIKFAKSWRPVGYIEIQMPLLMCKPRHELFANGFKHSKRPIEWEEWNQSSLSKFTNTIVRIARVVIGPEYRGLGLTRKLIHASMKFSKDRWQIRGVRPLFMEISAEMLNYIDFVSSSGFRKVGMTEGNLKRLVADLTAMNRGYASKGGIMSLQKKYLDLFNSYVRDTGNTFEETQERLKQILKADDPASLLTPTEWVYFRPIIRTRIPYYLAPLDEDAATFLDEYVEKPKRKNKSRFSVAPAIIQLSISAVADVPIIQTRNTRIIMESFGLVGENIRSTLLDSIPITATGGNIIFISGTSGSGKSVLLQALDPVKRSERSTGNIDFTLGGVQNYSAGWLEPLPRDIALFDCLAGKYGPERAFAALSETGLSEAMTLIKPFWMLSKGQQYRAMLADLLLRDQQVWLLDEFGADLDPLTAKIVANNLRRQVMRTNRIAFIASANHSHYFDSLKPTCVLVLRAGQDALLLRNKEYRNEFLNEAI